MMKPLVIRIICVFIKYVHIVIFYIMRGDTFNLKGGGAMVENSFLLANLIGKKLTVSNMGRKNILTALNAWKNCFRKKKILLRQFFSKKEFCCTAKQNIIVNSEQNHSPTFKSNQCSLCQIVILFGFWIKVLCDHVSVGKLKFTLIILVSLLSWS